MHLSSPGTAAALAVAQAADAAERNDGLRLRISNRIRPEVQTPPRSSSSSKYETTHASLISGGNVAPGSQSESVEALMSTGAEAEKQTSTLSIIQGEKEKLKTM